MFSFNKSLLKASFRQCQIPGHINGGAKAQTAPPSWEDSPDNPTHFEFPLG